MDDAKRIALIRLQAAKKKESDDVALTTTVASNLSIKRKPVPKGDLKQRNQKFLWSPS